MSSREEGDEMAENAKHSWPRIVSALVVLALAGAYVVQIVRGRIVGEHRLGTNDTIIVALALFVSVLLLYPEMLGRLSRLELPGLKVELEAVKQKQEEQGGELANIKLLLPLLLPEKERAHLRNLENGQCGAYEGGNVLRTELRHLRSIDLIRRSGNRSISEMKDGTVCDLRDYVELTPLGKEWLRRLSDIEEG
jgi:hypothetical protein